MKKSTRNVQAFDQQQGKGRSWSRITLIINNLNCRESHPQDKPVLTLSNKYSIARELKGDKIWGKKNEIRRKRITICWIFIAPKSFAIFVPTYSIFLLWIDLIYYISKFEWKRWEKINMLSKSIEDYQNTYSNWLLLKKSDSNFCIIGKMLLLTLTVS